MPDQFQTAILDQANAWSVQLVFRAGFKRCGFPRLQAVYESAGGAFEGHVG
jgi:hypothetical protein